MAVEANVRAFLLEMGRVGGGVERDDPEITWTVGGSLVGYHNAVVACRASPEQADVLIEAWAEELDAVLLPSRNARPAGRPRRVCPR